DGAYQDDQDDQREPEEHDSVHVAHVGVTSRTMPSALTTRTLVPLAMGSGLLAAQSSPAIVIRPVPVTGSMSCVTTPWRPMRGSVREGTPRPPSRATSPDRRSSSETLSTVTNVAN